MKLKLFNRQKKEEIKEKQTVLSPLSIEKSEEFGLHIITYSMAIKQDCDDANLRESTEILLLATLQNDARLPKEGLRTALGDDAQLPKENLDESKNKIFLCNKKLSTPSYKNGELAKIEVEVRPNNDESQVRKELLLIVTQLTPATLADRVKKANYANEMQLMDESKTQLAIVEEDIHAFESLLSSYDREHFDSHQAKGRLKSARKK